LHNLTYMLYYPPSNTWGFFMAEIRAVSKIRKLFNELQRPLTLPEIKTEIPDLRSCDVSMALRYLIKQRYASREYIDNPVSGHRKRIYQYTYSDVRLPNEN